MNNGNIAILGMGASGMAVLRYFLSEGLSPICVDASDHVLARLRSCGFSVLKDDDDIPSDVRLIARSPGIKDNHPWIQAASSKHILLTSEMEIAANHLESRGKSLGVTGTNGKTTTTLFTNHLLHLCGISSLPVGNIGLPLLDACRQIDVDSFVIEMSSFQLGILTNSPRFLLGAAILNFSDNHLDYHISMDAYREAKVKILHGLLPQGIAYIGSGLEGIKGRSLLEAVESFRALLCEECELLDTLYAHDIENYATGFALAGLVTVVSKSILIRALRTFVKPRHRLEHIGDFGGVCFINDSKSTTVASVLTAIAVVKESQILILGGRNKGGNFALLIPHIRFRVKLVLIIGESQDEIVFALEGSCDVMKLKSLSEAVVYAVNVSQPGDVILFSPGCSSLDQFNNYEERGNMFKELVFNWMGEKV